MAERKRPRKKSDKPKRLQLTVNMENFCRLIVKGVSRQEAFLQSYPNSRLTDPKAIQWQIGKLMKNPKVQARIEEMRDIEKARLQALAVWEKYDSVLALKEVVKTNLEDMNRVKGAITEEITLLEMQLEQAISKEDEKAASDILKKIISKRKQRASHMTNNVGIVNAVTELNKMHGFYPERDDKSITATVVFKGENELEE